jgi:hypothetical protein
MGATEDYATKIVNKAIAVLEDALDLPGQTKGAHYYGRTHALKFLHELRESPYFDRDTWARARSSLQRSGMARRRRLNKGMEKPL